MDISLEKCVKEFKLFQKNNISELQKIVKANNTFSSTVFNAKTDIQNGKFDNKNVVYYFKIKSKIKSEIICKHISEEKNNNKYLKLPKVNSINIMDGEVENRVLYVGKSLGKFSARLNQHQGNESPKTYALHLKEWKRIFGTEIQLELFYIYFNSDKINSNPELLELIETSLHNRLKPILGRTGH